MIQRMDWDAEASYIEATAEQRGNVPEMNHSAACFRRYCEMQEADAGRRGLSHIVTRIRSALVEMDCGTYRVQWEATTYGNRTDAVQPRAWFDDCTGFSDEDTDAIDKLDIGDSVRLDAITVTRVS